MSLSSNKAEDKSFLARELKCAAEWSPRCARISSGERSGKLNVKHRFLCSVGGLRQRLRPEWQKSVWSVLGGYMGVRPPLSV